MEFRKSYVSSSHERFVPSSLAEIHKKPPTSLTQKVIPIKASDDLIVSDISQISDIGGENDNEFTLMNYNLLNIKNTYPSNFPQMQSKPLNAALLTDHAILEQTVEPKLQHIHQQTASIQQKNPSLDLSNTIVELDKTSKLELIQSSDLSVPILWECLQRQDEKWKSLSQQIAQILEQKTVPCQSNPKTALIPNHEIHSTSEFVVSQKESSVSSPGNRHVNEPYSPKNSFGNENRENTKLFDCLQAQTKQIQRLQEQNQKLQEQIQKLLEQNIKLLEDKQQLQECNQELKCKLLFASKRKSLGKPERACENEQPTVPTDRQNVSVKENHCIGSHREQTEAKVNKSAKPKPDAGNVEYREEEIEKTSTSTVTSFIYQKLTTVTTESLRTPENRPSPKDAASSSRKKTGKCSKCGKCSLRNANEKAISPHYNSLNASKNGCRITPQATPESGGKTGYDTLQTCEEEIQVHNEDSERASVPRYENILRNVNELNLNCNEVETTPRIKPPLKPSLKGRKKYTPPIVVDLSPKTENRPYLNQRKSYSTSNTSTYSAGSPDGSIQETSPKKSDLDSKLQEANTISVYGLSSPNLSKDTKKYLENHGLIQNRPQCSKSRTTLVERYLR